jgi:glycosyltransferase involved in cell wall biosynthesis
VRLHEAGTSRRAVAGDPSIERWVEVSSLVLEAHPDAAELLVHAAAQLPDSVGVAIPVTGSERSRLELLATAYGIAERVTFEALGTDCSSDEATKSRVTALFDERRPLGEIVESIYSDADPPASFRNDDSILARQRVAIVTNHPAHYRLPLFATMAERLAIVEATLRVFFLGRQPRGRPWLVESPGVRFEAETLTSFALPIRHRRPSVAFDLERRLARFEPTVVLAAGFSPLSSGRAARFAARRRIPYGIWSGEISSASTAAGKLRRLQRDRLLRRAAFAIAYGSLSAEYLRQLNRALPLVLGRNSTPVAADANHRERREGRVELVVVGDLTTRRKGVDVAIDALRTLPNLPCRLTVVGGGALIDEFRSRAAGDPRVRFLGSQSPREVRSVLAQSDALLFPTRADIFGLVLVEGMGSSLATITSRAAGAAADLAVDGVNCLVVGSGSPAAWAESIRLIVDDVGLQRELGARARATIARRWTLDHSADAMLAGLRLGILAFDRDGSK